MAQRNPTKPHGADPASAPDDGLSPKQRTAVDLLSSGQTLTATAEALSLDRWTVSQWVNHHAPFQAQLNARRHELWRGIVEGLRGLLPKALAVLQEELEGEGPGRMVAAKEVFRMVGLYGTIGPPTGPTSVEDLEQEQRRQALERTRTVLTEEDIALARQRRESDRTMAALMSLNVGPLLPQP